MYIAAAKRLTHRGAKQMAATAIAGAEQAGIAITVAIADAGGHLILLERMDGGRFHTVHSSTTKAVCAASNKPPDHRAGRAGSAARRRPRHRARARGGTRALDRDGGRISRDRRRRMYRRDRGERRRLGNRRTHRQGGGRLHQRGVVARRQVRTTGSEDRAASAVRGPSRNFDTRATNARCVSPQLRPGKIRRLACGFRDTMPGQRPHAAMSLNLMPEAGAAETSFRHSGYA
jgi:hypothetical protein